MTRYLLLFGFFFAVSLHADDDSLDFHEVSNPSEFATESNSLVNLAGTPSSVVHGCVNAITGDFQDYECDLVIPGADPLTFERSYSSSDHRRGSLYSGWFHNHSMDIIRRKDEMGNQYTFHLEGSSKTLFDNVTHPAKNSKDYWIQSMSRSQISKGMTNCGHGEISGRTNVKNNRLHFRDKIKKYFMTYGSGQKCEFEKVHGKLYHLINTQKTNRNQKVYIYDDNHSLRRIIRKNSSDVDTGFLRFNFLTKRSQLEHRPWVSVQSHDGREVTYHLTEYKRPSGIQTHKHRFVITKVERPNAPWLEYEYNSPTSYALEQIHTKHWPEQRYLKIDYYVKKEEYDVDGDHLKIRHSNNPNFNKVYQLKAPVGSDATPVTIYTFKYESYDKKNKNNPYTSVYDAYGNLTVYNFNETSKRLSSIKKFNTDSTLACKQEFYWGSSDDESNLKSILVEDGEGKGIVSRHYSYDGNGNIIKDTLYGNLTGNSITPVQIKKGDKPEDNSCEWYTKAFSYTKDGLNLVTSSQELHVGWNYEYYPKTELLKSKLCNSNGFKTREFYDYDDSGALIETISDNGSQRGKDDLTDVTHRFIKVIENTTAGPVGLPKVISEYCLDVSTNTNRLLKKTVNTYDVCGRVIQQDLYDADGILAYTLYKEFDDHGNVLIETNPLGQTIYRQYDANDNLIYEQGPNSLFHMEYTYDFCNRLIREDEVQASGERLTKTHRYDYKSNKIGSTDIYGNETCFEYDAFGRVVKTIFPEVPDLNGILYHPTIALEYDCLGNCISKTDACGNTTKTSYTAYNKPYCIEYCDGSVERFEYLKNGELVKEIAKDGSYTIYTKDYLQRPTKIETYDAAGTLLKSVSKTYNGFHLLTETAPSGITTYYHYDAAGRLSSVVTGDAKKEHFYDSLGRQYEERRYFGQCECDYVFTKRQYDLMDRVIEETEECADGIIQKRTCYSYDAGGNKSSITIFTDSGASQLMIDYDSHNQPIRTIDGLGNINYTFYNYHYVDEHGHFVPYSETVDAKGNITVSIKDALGHPTTEFRKNGFGDVVKSTDSKYDNNGNQIARIDYVIVEEKVEKQITTTWEYDSFGRVTRLCEASGTPEQRFSGLEYDQMGRAVRTIKPDGTSILSQYDGLGRLVDYRASDASFHYTYEYDAFDHPVTIVDMLTQTTTLRSYDANGKLSKETCGNGLIMEYEIDSLGRTTSLRYPDGSGVHYAYHGGCVAAVTRTDSSGDTLYSHQYLSYDLSGNCTEAKLIGNCGTLKQHYDLLCRTVSIEANDFQETIIEYDCLGNIRSIETVDALGANTGTYDYDALNQITSERGWVDHDYLNDSLSNQVVKDGSRQDFNSLNQLLGDDHAAFVYDLNGNLLKKNQNGVITEFRYDALNRLVEVVSDGTSYRYCYDSFNRRLSKRQEGREERFLYAGVDEVGLVDNQGRLQQLRILGIGKGSEIGAAIAVEIESNTYAPLHTHSGHVKAIVDVDTGKAVETYRYSAFGIESVNGGSEVASNPWRFASKRTDSETGLIYFGERYYDPSTSRWITNDPIGFQGGPNLYAYVQNSPLNLFDLYGLEAQGGYLDGWNQYNSIDMGYNKYMWMGDDSYLIDNPHYNHLPKGPHVNPEFDKSQFNCRGACITRVGGYQGKNWAAFINGIGNSYFESIGNGEHLSRCAGGHAIDVIYRPTHGVMNDIWGIALARSHYILSDAAIMLKFYLDDFFANADPDARLALTGHSAGCTDIRNVLMLLPRALQERIDVVAIAPSAYIGKHLCGSVVHYCNENDGIWMSDPATREDRDGTVRIIPKTWYHDGESHHSFQDSCYTNKLEGQMFRLLPK